jgi:hypothetical protein
MEEAMCSFETSVDLHRTTRYDIAEDRTAHIHSCESLESNIIKSWF